MGFPYPKPGSQGTPVAQAAEKVQSWFDLVLSTLPDSIPSTMTRLGIESIRPDDSPGAMMANAVSPLGMAAENVGKVLAGGVSKKATVPKVAEALEGSTLGNIGASKFRSLNKALKDNGGFTVDMKTGATPTTGTFVGLHPNTDSRVMVIPKKHFTEKALSEYVSKMQKELAGNERYLGGWVDGDNVYLDVPLRVVRDPKEVKQAFSTRPETAPMRARRLEAQERAAIVRGGGRDRTNPDPAAREAGAQKAVFTADTLTERQVGDWRGYIDSPTFERRAIEQADAGLRYLQERGVTNPEWWKLRGTTWEKLYGDLPDGTMSDDRMKQVASALAATAPNAGTTENVRQATEYLRRMLKSEPAIQPEWRAKPGVNVTHAAAGTQMPMETVRANNLVLGREGRGLEMNADKVREEYKALIGDPDAEVLDTHFAKIGEVPQSGVYINSAAGKIQDKEYGIMADRLRGIARKLGRDPRDWTAEVWTGIRENVKRHGELYGQKFKRAEGESYGYDQILDREIEFTAQKLGLEPKEVERRIRAGDMNLLAALLSTGGIAAAYAFGETPPEPGS